MKIIGLVFLGIYISHSIHAIEEAELLIISCGGGGTHYTSACFQVSGFDLNHERFGKYGYIGWPLTVSPFFFNGKPLPLCKHIFHQVRNPLHVIACWINLYLDHPAWKFIRDHVPEINRDDSIIVQSAKYWYYWNLIAEPKAEWRYKVEDFSLLLDEFEERLSISFNREAISTIPTNTGSWIWAKNKRKITWEILENELPQDLYENIRNMAIRYNYL